MQFAKLCSVALAGATLAACASSGATGPKEGAGTFFGALSGAVLGSQIGGGTKERMAAAAAGALIGGLIGNRIGAALDDEDKRRAYAAQIRALEYGRSGAPTAWRNPDSGRHGAIVPGPAYDQGARKCRQYTHTIYIDGRPQTARGTACRNVDGSWTPLG